MATDHVIFTVNTYDNLSETTKEYSIATINNAKGADFEKETLGSIRQKLIAANVLSSTLQRCAFCTPSGAEVKDTTLFIDVKPEAFAGDVTAANYNIYFRKDKTQTKVDDSMKDFLSQKLDDQKTPEASKAALKELASSFQAAAWTANTSDKITYPADMDEKNWDIVIRNNSLLSGLAISPTKLDNTGDTNDVKTKPHYAIQINNSYYPAFTLKARELGSLETPQKPDIDVKPLYSIPRFRVADGSYVEVYETANSIAASMYQSSFSQSDVEASIGGGTSIVSGTAKAAFSQKDQESLSAASKTESKTMHITYNFPRVIVSLDKDSLEPSAECKAEIDYLLQRNIPDKVPQFHAKFGHLYPTWAELGGRLYFSQQSSAVSGSSVEEKSKALKMAASASFSSTYVQGSASASHEKQTQDGHTQEESSFQNAITWHAQGGDTLLCNNPPAWCPTVGSFYNWRVVKLGGFVNLLDLLDKFSGLSDKVESLRLGGKFSRSLSLQNFTPGLATHPKDTAAHGATKAESEGKPGQNISQDESITSTVYFTLKAGNSYLGSMRFGGPNTEQMLAEEREYEEIPRDFSQLMERSGEKNNPKYRAYADMLKESFQWYNNISLCPKNVRDARGVVVGIRHLYILKCLAKSSPENAFKLQYKVPYEFSTAAYGPILASSTLPGIYHKSFLCMQEFGFKDKSNSFTTQFQLRSAEAREGLVMNGDKLYLQVLRPGQSADQAPEVRGNASKILKHAIGLEEYTNLEQLQKIEFTFEYGDKA